MKNEKQTVLLTGATGFLGSHILEALVAWGKYEIICLKRSSSSLDRIFHLTGKFKTFDVDTTPIEQVFKGRKVYAIIHTATEYGRGSSSSYKVLETNLMFPIALIEEGIKHGVQTFLNTDSYFNKENMSYSYLLNYSLSKKSLNSWLKYYSSQIKVINIVVEHIYGPKDSGSKFIERMIQDIAVKKVPIVQATYGHQKRDFIYVTDVVSAYLALLELANHQSFHYRSYSVGTGQSKSIRSAMELMAQISKSPTKIEFGKVPYRDDEIMNSVGDISEISNLGWKPEYDLASGLKETIRHYQEGR
jgi:CDP-paratose synthetase